MSVTVAFIMLIIGSNLARAFSLVGALSIVRYRNAVKDTQDISYIFMALAIGMAAGTKLYLYAIIFTLFGAILLMILNRFAGKFDPLLPSMLVLKGNIPDKEKLKEALKLENIKYLKTVSREAENSDIFTTIEVVLPTESNFKELSTIFSEKDVELVKIFEGVDKVAL